MSRMDEERPAAEDAEIARLNEELAALARDAGDAQTFLGQLAAALFPAGPPERTQMTWPERAAAFPSFGRDGSARAEDRLRAAEIRYRTLVEQIPAVTFLAVLGEGDNEIYVSPHIEALLGFTQQEWLENPFLWYQQLHPDDRALWNEEFARGCRTGGPFHAECRFLTRDGRVVWVRGEARVVRDPVGRPLFLQGVAFDITTSKNAEALLLREAVRTTEERYRGLVEGLGAVVWEARPAPFAFTLVSRHAEELLGFPPERWVGDDTFWPSRIHPDDLDEIRGGWRMAVLEGNDHTFEYRAIAADGRTVWLQDNMRIIRDADGRAQHILGVMLDVTARKLAEEDRARLLEAAETARRAAEEANRAKDEFLATMSHELRTPLTSVLGWTRMVRNGHLDAAATARALETIERNAHAQVQLVDDILDVSRIITGKLRLDVHPVDLRSVVEAARDVVRLAAHAKGVLLDVSVDAPVGTLMGDAQRLQQVVWNLLSNAIKFTPSGGRVRLSLERTDTTVRIVVSDTGAGIAPEFLPYVFDRFRQADSSTTRTHGGLGLGLAIVRHIVEQHGGSVRAESPGVNRGATMTVELPRGAEIIAEALPPAPDERPQPLRGVRALVVDDQPDARELVKLILQTAGAEVVAVASAEAALATIATAKPTVVVSDIAMPDQDGYELLRELRARGIRVPAVAITAYGHTEDRDRALRSGFAYHVGKPIDPERFIEIIGALRVPAEDA
ncbi:MAG TPA: PAS domain-containing protein [Terriglobales bacterium]|nr:PAS domain-containing protein [Terriglobales bacterium]